jgi:hypothetical protein
LGKTTVPTLVIPGQVTFEAAAFGSSASVCVETETENARMPRAGKILASNHEGRVMKQILEVERRTERTEIGSKQDSGSTAATPTGGMIGRAGISRFHGNFTSSVGPAGSGALAGVLRGG